ncbi:hypothetical protein [Sorangium sp. So ce385]|uniref:hypothetical protein n=1 Tax=Sorangium sp. So ce385 TaxID=3133308 RepID=UPI003F5C3B63
MIRDKAVEISRGVVGLTADANKPESRLRYIALIAPGETKARATELATDSGCGLVVAGIWRELGVKARQLTPPYVTGTAIRRLRELALAANAWVPFKQGAHPDRGDMVLVGDNHAGGPEHVFTVVSVDNGSQGPEIESVDGGQIEHGYQIVQLKRRVWRGNRDVVLSGSAPGAAAGTGRVIQGWADVSRLRFG